MIQLVNLLVQSSVWVIMFNFFVNLLWIFFCCFGFLWGHYFVDVVMVFLTTNAIFLFSFAVHLLLTILVATLCQCCFQYFCCNVAAGKPLLICLCHFPFFLVHIPLHCKNSDVAPRVDCLCQPFHPKMSFSSACDFLPFCHHPDIQ